MVDGVLASSYPSTHHDLAHIGILPIRFFPGIISKIFGDDDGSETFVNIAADLGEWFLPYGQKYGEM